MKTLMTLLFAGVFSFALVACEEGPAERAGERVDEAVEDTRNAVEDACEDATKENC